MATSSRLAELLGGAVAARQRGEADVELRLLDEALAAAPDDPHALNARGMRALADREFERARDWFAAAGARDPHEPALAMNLATACRALADDAGEAAALERALSIDRRHFIAQLRKAELHERRGEEIPAALAWSAVVQLAEAAGDRPPAVEAALARGRAFIARHQAGVGERLEAALRPRLAELGDDARRFTACVDHMLGRRPVYENQCAGIRFPFLPADEFFPRRHFPWFEALERRAPAIRAEALEIMRRGGDAIRPYVRQEAGTPANQWSALDHSLDWSACFLWEYGVRNEAVCALCPETAAALAAVPQNHVPGRAPTAFFSMLKPGAHIPPHTGVTNTRAIVHLALVVPDGCRLRVGGETRAWHEGQAFAFDDTIEHEAWNESAEPRIVLIFDVWNPHLSDDEQRLLAQMFEITGGAG